MEILFSLAVIVSIVTCVLYYGAKGLYYVWLKPKALERELRRQGIKGNPYKLIYGDLKENEKLIKEAWSKPMELSHKILPRVVPLVYRTSQKYGNKSMIWFGPAPRVILWEPDMMKEVLSNKFGHFQKPPVNSLIKLLAMGVSSLEGEEWAKRRRLITPAFHMEKLRQMVPSFRVSCIDMVKRWERLACQEGTCELDVWPEFQRLTGDVISQTAFGSSFEEGKRIFELQKEQAHLVIEAARTLYLPGFRFLPTQKNRRRRYVDREIKYLLRDMINKKLQSMKEGNFTSDDLLSLMLQNSSQSNIDIEGKSSRNEMKLTIEDVIEECKLFYFAGQETTSVWLTWTLIVLAMHQEWQQRAREEVLEIMGDKTPDIESISHLKVVAMVLYEVLRLYPPAVALIRYTYKPMELGGVTYPAEVNLLLPTIMFHHDPKYWGEDAEEFNPERFSQGISKASKGQNAFFPFGWGPRICLGMNFAMIEAKMALSMVLKNFSFKLSPSYSHAPYTVITMQPQYGAQVILQKL